MNKSIPLLVATAVVAAFGIASWFGKTSTAADTGRPASLQAETDSAPGVSLDTEALKRAGIETAPVQPGNHRLEIEAIATALPAQELIDAAANLATAQSQADKVDAALAASRKEYERLKGLHGDERNVSDKALEAAEAARRGDEASSRAAHTGLDAAMNATRSRWGELLAKAMLENSPSFRRLAEGKEVLLRVASPSGVSTAAPAATLTLKDDSGRTTTARLLSVSPMADPRIQGAAFFYLASADGILPGMTLAARFPSGPKQAGASLPATAIIWWQGKAWTYVPTMPGRFERREVAGAVQLADSWFAPGFADQHVVTRGAQTLLSEELRSAIQVGEEGK